MIVELINTGSELMLGRVLNTHQQWLCRQFADRGIRVHRQVAVADTAAEITAAVRDALGRADLVVTTGGLGPTSDDLTREAIAKLLGRDLREDPALVAHIEAFFAARKRRAPPRTRVQALVPRGARVLPNPHGTAPGLVMEVNPNPFRPDGRPGWLVMLPGPPRELRPMFRESVVPWLERTFPPTGHWCCRTLRTTGIGESAAQELLEAPLAPLVARGLEIGYCARPGQVDVRLAARSPEAQRLVSEAEALVRAQLGPFIYGEEDDELEAVLVRLLTERRQTLALAESCTGGALAHRLTNVPGASAVFRAGIVAYANDAKEIFLGVQAGTLAQHGAVSEPTAREMAEGARQRAQTDFALAITGIAGPGGGTADKPVGTAFIALATRQQTRVLRVLNPLDRETFKQVTTNQALDLLRR
ncbi:MAG: competence/damage-inducible protein A, partial [Verrucomicrobiae bacterium]|nr:competence/damage-inducible protein A [Verrucomicrobiae bacterium]